MYVFYVTFYGFSGVGIRGSVSVCCEIWIVSCLLVAVVLVGTDVWCVPGAVLSVVIVVHVVLGAIGLVVCSLLRLSVLYLYLSYIL